MPLLSGTAVFRLIPQKAPMVMVDTLWLNDEKKTIAGLAIASGNIFVEDGFFSEAGIIEHIAQTAALRTGYSLSLIQEDTNSMASPAIGYIGAIKKLEIVELPPVGSVLKTTIEQMQVIFDVTLIQAKVELQGTTIAQCEMKIFLKKEENLPHD